MTIIVTIYSVFTLYYILSYYLHKWSVMKVFLFRVPPPLPTNPEDLEKLYQRNSRLINIVHDFFVYMDLGDFINICINAALILCWLCTSARYVFPSYRLWIASSIMWSWISSVLFSC